MRAILFVVNKGVPWDVARKLKIKELRAFCIILSEIELPEDQHFDFDKMNFKEPQQKK